MAQVKETKKIVLSELKKQIEEGMKKDELAKFYGLPVTQMTKLLKSAGLEIRKFRRPSFELIDDTEKVTETPNQPEEKTSEVDKNPIAEATVVSEENANLAESTPEGNEPANTEPVEEVANVPNEIPFEDVEEGVVDTLGGLWGQN